MNSSILIKEKIKKENFYNYSLNTHTDKHISMHAHTQTNIHTDTHVCMHTCNTYVMVNVDWQDLIVT